MEPVRELVRSVDIEAGTDHYLLTLHREDFSHLYPGMVRFTLAITSGERTLALFRTNSYEYSPQVPLSAENVARRTADEWEHALRLHPSVFILDHRETPAVRRTGPVSDLVVIQGSPRGDGNCSILAGWAVDAAHDLKKTAQVIFPHDMDIRCCIGCYQCYNTGSCVFHDDMESIIDAIRGSSLLIICSPVYTNTVPGGLKLVIDRCQAYHAERALAGGKSGQKGLIFSVAGRKGKQNFFCITSVLSAFLKNLGIKPAEEVLIDSVDSVKDIRTIPGMQQNIQNSVKQGLLLSGGKDRK
jgi:multimeric flavodoxin WrbA